MSDLLEMSDLEMEISRVQGELRELRREITHQDDQKMRGYDIDEAAYAETKARVEELTQRQRDLYAQQDVESGFAEPESGVGAMKNSLIDFALAYKYFIGLAIIGLGVVGFQLFLHEGSAKFGEQAANKQLQIMDEFMDEDMKRAPERMLRSLQSGQ